MDAPNKETRRLVKMLSDLGHHDLASKAANLNFRFSVHALKAHRSKKMLKKALAYRLKVDDQNRKLQDELEETHKEIQDRLNGK